MQLMQLMNGQVKTLLQLISPKGVLKHRRSQEFNFEGADFELCICKG